MSRNVRFERLATEESSLSNTEPNVEADEELSDVQIDAGSDSSEAEIGAEDQQMGPDERRVLEENMIREWQAPDASRQQNSRIVLLIGVLFATMFAWRILLNMQQLPFCERLMPPATSALTPHIHNTYLLPIGRTDTGNIITISVWSETEALEVERCVQTTDRVQEQWWKETRFSGSLSYMFHVERNQSSGHNVHMSPQGLFSSRGHMLAHADGHFAIWDAMAVVNTDTGMFETLLSVIRYDNHDDGDRYTKAARYSLYRIESKQCGLKPGQRSNTTTNGGHPDKNLCAEAMWLRDVDAPATFYPASTSLSSDADTDTSQTALDTILIAVSAPDCLSGISRHTQPYILVYRHNVFVHRYDVTPSFTARGTHCPPVVQAVFGDGDSTLYAYVGHQYTSSKLDDVPRNDLKWRYSKRRNMYPNYEFELCSMNMTDILIPPTDTVLPIDNQTRVDAHGTPSTGTSCRVIDWSLAKANHAKDRLEGVPRVIASHKGQAAVLLYTESDTDTVCMWANLEDGAMYEALTGQRYDRDDEAQDAVRPSQTDQWHAEERVDDHNLAALRHLCSPCGVPGQACHGLVYNHSVPTTIFERPLTSVRVSDRDGMRASSPLSPALPASDALTVSQYAFPLFEGSKYLVTAETPVKRYHYPLYPRTYPDWDKMVESDSMRVTYALGLSVLSPLLGLYPDTKVPMLWSYDTIEDDSLSSLDLTEPGHGMYRMLIYARGTMDGSLLHPFTLVRYHNMDH